MKRLLAATLALLLLLCGCRKETVDGSGETTTGPAEPSVFLYDPDSLIEAETEGAVRAYPLGGAVCSGLAFMGDQLLMLESYANESTTMTLLVGEALGRGQSVTVDVGLSPDDGRLRVGETAVVYYDSTANAIVYLDDTLTESRRVEMPVEMVDLPVIGTDMKTVYYCTASQIRAMDLDTGADRLVREYSGWLSLDGVLFDDTVLEVFVSAEEGDSYVAFVSTDSGETVGEDPYLRTVSSWGDAYYVQRLEGTEAQLLYGILDGETATLAAKSTDTVFDLLPMNALLTASKDGQLSLYDLESGRKTAATSFRGTEQVYFAEADPSGRYIWLLVWDYESGCQNLCRWEPGK